MAARAHRGKHCTIFALVLLSNSEYTLQQLVSVMSLLSSDTPNLESPANVDAAKEVRTDLAGKCLLPSRHPH